MNPVSFNRVIEPTPESPEYAAASTGPHTGAGAFGPPTRSLCSTSCDSAASTVAIVCSRCSLRTSARLAARRSFSWIIFSWRQCRLAERSPTTRTKIPTMKTTTERRRRSALSAERCGRVSSAMFVCRDRRSLGDANEKTRKSGRRRANAAAQMVRWLTDRQRPQFSAKSAAFPPAAVVSIDTARSTANRCR